MPTEDLKSTSLTNLDATPPVLNAAGRGGAPVIFLNESITVGAAATLGSIYRFIRVWSGWTMVGFQVDTEDFQATSGTWDMGLYAINGGAVVDADCFLDGVNSSGSVTNTGWGAVGSGTGANAINGELKQFWQIAAGVSADPQTYYDVGIITAGGDNDQANKIHVAIMYVDLAP